MDLFDEEILKPKKKKEIKASTIILIAIVVLLILCVLTIMAIVYLKGTILTITLDDQKAGDLEDILIFEENDKVYIPIKRMAEYLKYDAYNGDYITRSEDATKCYIETGDELISFTSNSNILTKVNDNQTQQVKIAEAVKEINGELCVTSEAAEDAFNISFYYDVGEKKIYIQTLAYLYTAYSRYYRNRGYVSIENETFANKTAILDGMLIVKSENNYYGVITVSGVIVLETKYDSIEYLRKTSDFLVTSNNKKGIISNDKTTKVELVYDSIESVTNKNNILYVVAKSNLYGLLDESGKTIIYPEYEQIGVDVSSYEQNGVTNGYILYNQIVPVKMNNKWALFDINGNKVTDFIYDSFGCTTGNTSVARTYGVIEVPDYNLIVGCQNKKYNLITLEGKEIFTSAILDSVYITVSEGKNIYYITSGTVTKELAGLLEENGISKTTTAE